MRVTMDIFSGRPNPSWRLSLEEARELVDRVAGEPVRTPAERPTTLGFRSFIVAADTDDPAERAGLPFRFTVGERAAAGPGADTLFAETAFAPVVTRGAPDPAADSATGRWLLRTTKGAVSDDLCNVVHETLDPTVRRAHSMAVAPAGTEAPVAPDRAPIRAPATDGARCHPFLTPLRLGFWNSLPIRPYNNCYNYASNFASNTLAQPGRRSGQLYTSFDCEAVVAAAAADGCLSACEGTQRVMALAIWPSFDFHWWRLHPNGVWAQKLGWWSATNRDNSGRIMGNGLTPENSDRAPYSTFCGYFYAPLGMWVT